VGWANLKDFLNHNSHALREWRGVYYILDRASRRGYVGAAYGAQNLLGRWREYAASGHGGNKRLKGINPRRFQFSILQLVAPSMEQEDVVRLEQSWIRRLQTRTPYGLNDWHHSSS
jgi:hypothetical protein